ncbi:aminoacyl-tRNA hydrolase [Mycoplasmopsis equigenitalium]|uniref:Peptidyl-tRNA hydrolase n=1 Tax=Mycoplasmopsis equigenitalium TaxID=114883 RepID=A0ABY5J425_9BACT|nr:aminoacyl-tRNA hydrolase [Mycoplasmopsis equigenitalium]UUD36892.1 aminoacyl-tRNA hydrolase [Mycoplasmopsis equigenitalium]
MKLIVGLGNETEKYANTRHNYGFIVLDAFAQKYGLEFNKEKFNGVFTKLNDFIIAKPKTFMNLSGEFVRDICHFYNIRSDDVLVIHDDVSLPIGSATLKVKGGGGNHNGVKNVLKMLKVEELNRLKLGVGKDPNYEMKDWVLSKFTPEERQIINSKLDLYVDAISCFIYNDIYVAMNNYNAKLKGNNE